eukprot:gene42719-56785_t
MWMLLFFLPLIATVYRTVRLFEEAGIIDRLDFRDGRSRYEEHSDDHHDHLIDLKTGHVLEFVDPEIERMQQEIARRLGYRLADPMFKKRLMSLMLISCAALMACQPAGANQDNYLMEGVDGKAAEAPLDANGQAAKEFLEKNKSAPGGVTTASGLPSAIISKGPETGPKPAVDSMVQVNYEGKLLNGEVFDSSFARGEAAEFEVGRLIPACVDALQMM